MIPTAFVYERPFLFAKYVVLLLLFGSGRIDAQQALTIEK